MPVASPYWASVQILAEFFPDAGHFANNIVNVQHHLHHADLLVIDGWIKFFLYLRLTYVINRKSKLDSRQWTCISGVTVGDCFSGKAASLALSRTQKNNYVLGAVLLGKTLYPPLVFQIHCSCGGSDKALGGRKHHLCPGGSCAGGDSLSGYSVPVAYYHCLFTG